jgi:hypothetical protein
MVGLPWGFLLEFHGWFVLHPPISRLVLIGVRWHLLTGVSSYIYMTLVEIILTDPQVKQQDKYRNLYAWPMSVLLAPIEQVESNGHAI